MSNWNQYVVTDKGRTLLAETGIKDNALTFLSLKTSSHVYTKDQLAGLTSLGDVQGTFPFTAKETVNNTSVKLECIVSNKDVATAYTWNTIGIYAADSTGAETLYAVSTAIDPVQMKPIKDGNLNQFTLTIYLQVGNAEKVEIQVQMDAYVSLQVFEAFQTTVTKQLATMEQDIYNKLYPVGRTILDFGDTDPNDQFPWMTWVKVGEGSALITAGDTYKVGVLVGANSKTIPLKAMPVHTHEATTDNQGSHTHNGSTNWAGGHRHRFWLDARWQSTHDDDGENLNDVNHGGHGLEPCWTSTNGGHSHSVTITDAGGHTHTVTVKNAGGGEAFDVMQQSIPVWVWKRTA